MTTYSVYVDARVRVCFEVEADSEDAAIEEGWNFDGGSLVLEVYEVTSSDAIEIVRS